MMTKIDDGSVKINHDPNWPHILEYPFKILIIGGQDQRKTNMLLNLIKHQQPGIDKIYLQVKDPFELKYQLLIDVMEKERIKKLKNPKLFTEYS